MNKILASIRRYLRSADLMLVFLVLVSAFYGLVLIYSATRYMGSDRTFIVQLGGIVIGFVAMILLSIFDFNFFASKAIFIYIFCILLLVATLVFGFGEEETGNKSWISLGFVNVQPSELVKVGFILTFARHIEKLHDRLNSIRALLLLGLHAGTIIALVLLQKDMGTALVFVFITIAMLFAGGLRLSYFLGGLLATGLASPFLWDFLSNNQKMRIIYGFNPEGDPLNFGYQALKSKIIIGSGGVSGLGYLQGPQIQSGSLFAQHTDFIFAAAGEELGFVGCAAIILLLLLISTRVLSGAFSATSRTGSLICAGVLAILIFQTVENIGMCLALLPVIGITLPFFSGGGSSILSMFLCIGLVLSVRRRRPGSMFEREE